MTEPTIDPATYAALEETAGADFVVELVDTFLAEAPAMLAELRASFTAGNADTFRRAAHSLKSNANTFGALRLGMLARELEQGGLERARAAGTPQAALGALEQEYARVAAALAELRDA
jgi:HPt (histidine-containing phosphotransfer) domain-containing protein